jgi:NAD(P)-dependent dehydrogenase (short-subunit alcohol dehydrogenase family)
MRFDEKTAIVAGGGQGIGAAIAVALAAEGALVSVWDINEEGARQTALKIQANGGKAKAVKMDVLDYAQVKSGVDQVVKESGKLDIMISTVGGGKFMPVQHIPPALFEQQVRFNLFSMFNCAHAALGPMLEKDSGKMLFFISATGGTPNLVGYEAGKAGIVSVIQTMVAELTKTKININAINPNMTDTPLTRDAFKAIPNGEKMLEQAAAAKPLGINTPDNVAKLALFLVSDDAERLTGQFITSL